MMPTKIKVNWGGKLFPFRFSNSNVCAFGTVKAKPELSKDQKINGNSKWIKKSNQSNVIIRDQRCIFQMRAVSSICMADRGFTVLALASHVLCTRYNVVHLLKIKTDFEPNTEWQGKRCPMNPTEISHIGQNDLSRDIHTYSTHRNRFRARCRSFG